MNAVPVADAARLLNIPPGTLRKWIKRGAPVAQRGSRGRGRATLVDPDAIRQWRAPGQGERVLVGGLLRTSDVMQLAERVPELAAAGALEAFNVMRGRVPEEQLAAALVAGWFAMVAELLDHLRERCPFVPEPGATVPQAIEALRKIGRK